jgi:hypothetical protein
MGIINRIIGNNQAQQTIPAKLALEPEAGDVLPASTLPIQSGAGKDFAREALIESANMDNHILYHGLDEDAIAMERSLTYDYWFQKINKDEGTTPDEKFIASYSEKIPKKEPGLFKDISNSDLGDTYKDLNDFRENTLTAIASPIPGSAGQIVAYLATHKLPDSIESEPDRKKYYQTEALKMIVKSPITDSKEKETAMKALETKSLEDMEESLLEILNSEIHKDRNTLSKTEMEEFLGGSDESEETTQASIPSETDDRVNLGDTWVSKRKKAPPPPEIGLFQLKPEN